MDKNSIIGFVLIAAILFGFTFFQSRQAKKTAAENKVTFRQDSLVETVGQDVALVTEVQEEVKAKVQQAVPEPDGARVSGTHFKSPMLDEAFDAEGRIVAIENSLVRLELNTRGAQPYSVHVKDFYNHDSTDLYLFKPGECQYSISLYAGEFISTKDFTFNLVSLSDSVAVMRLPFNDGAYVEYTYRLQDGSYSVDHTVAFVGMNGLIPRNVSNFDLDFITTIPRMEKGFKNESQYSMLDYYFEGDKKPTEIGRGRSASKRVESRLSWFAFHQQFFSAIMRSPRQFQDGELTVKYFDQNDPSRNLMYCSAKMRQDFQLSDRVEIPYEFYFGPNHYHTLEGYGHKYEKIIPLGGWLVGWFTRFAIIPMFNLFHRFINSFGLIILLMTIVIKIVVLPFTFKSYSSSAKMQALKPEIEKINARYPNQDDAMKKQQATMELYKRAGVSPMGGCLPMLLTFPILWAMFRFFPASIELRQQPFLWCHDLSAYDSIVDFGTRIPLIGDHLSLFALLMAATMWIYSKLTMANQAASNDPNAKMMQMMSVWMMPIMMFFICNSLSAALSYYYLLSQLISIFETVVIRKFFVHPDEILAKVHATEGKPVPKSKWQLRLEEAQKMQQQQLREQQKKRR